MICFSSDQAIALWLVSNHQNEYNDISKEVISDSSEYSETELKLKKRKKHVKRKEKTLKSI
jgi:hypothetical protein